MPSEISEAKLYVSSANASAIFCDVIYAFLHPHLRENAGDFIRSLREKSTVYHLQIRLNLQKPLIKFLLSRLNENMLFPWQQLKILLSHSQLSSEFRSLRQQHLLQQFVPAALQQKLSDQNLGHTASHSSSQSHRNEGSIHLKRVSSQQPNLSAKHRHKFSPSSVLGQVLLQFEPHLFLHINILLQVC